MRLYLIRHAWAGDPDASLWPDDSRRPLTTDGRKRFRRVAEALVERGVHPQIIASSPYVRARETADLLAKSLPQKPPLVELSALEPESNVAEALAWTVGRNESQIAWVGHMPGMALLLASLVGAAEGNVEFKKGACAAVDFDAQPTLGGGQLSWFITAKMLGC